MCPAPPMSPRDADQVLRLSFDDATGSLRVLAEIESVIADLNIRASNGDNIAIADQTGANTLAVNPDGSTNTRITDGTDTLAINADGSINVDASIAGEVAIEVSAADGDNIAISDGTHTAVVNTDGSLNAITPNTLIISKFDFISATYPSGTQEVYVYKTGGSGGTTVATVTVNYTDSSKTALLNLTRT